MDLLKVFDEIEVIGKEIKKEVGVMAEKKTHVEYEKDVFRVHGDKIIVIGMYEGNRTKIKHKCNKCEHEWDVMPTNISSGRGCPGCVGKKKRTQEEYKSDLSQVHGDKISVIGTYENVDKKIKHKCNTCEREWDARPAKILSGTGCLKCSGNKKKTKEEYKIDLLKLHGKKISVIDTYKCNKTKIKHKCNVCGCEWSVQPHSILNGTGCPKCYSDSKKKTNKKYVEEVYEVHGNKISVIDTYERANKKTKHRCNTCEYEWSVLPQNILKGHGCPKCQPLIISEKLRKTNESYIKEVYKVRGNELSVIGMYEGNNKKIKHRCNTCEHEWDTVPSSILRGIGCPKCNESKGEKLINSILESCNAKFCSQVTFKNIGFKKRKRLRCDFVVYRDEDPIFVIEYNGEQHYKPIDFFGGEEGYKKTKERDRIKRTMLNEIGIPVIDIPYTETEEQIKSTIEYYIDTLIKKEHEFQVNTRIKSN